MYQYAEQEVENFFFYPIRNFDCCLIYEYDIPYLLCSTIQGRLSRSEFGGGGRKGGGKVPAPPPSPPLVEKVVDIQGITGDWSRPL